MKIKGYADSIAAGAGTVAEALARATTMPVLKNIALEAKDDELWMQATNLQIGITTKVAVNVIEPGRITVSGQLFADVLSSFEDEAEIMLTLDGSWLRYECDESSGEFATIEYDDFPVLPTPEEYGDPVAKLGAPQFVQMVGAIQHAISTDQARPELTGGLLEVFPAGRLRLSAADGFQAAKISEVAKVPERPNADGADVPILREIVPRKSLSLLRRLTEDLGLVAVFAGPQPSDLIFQTNNFRLVTQLIDGKFPTVSTVLEQGRDRVNTTIETYIEAFDAPFRRVRMFARKSEGGDTVDFTAIPPDAGTSPRAHPDEDPTGVLLFDVTSQEVGGGHERLGCAVSGRQMRVRFSSEYIQKVLSACPNKGARLRFLLSAPTDMMLVEMATDESDWLAGAMPRYQGRG